VRTSMPSASGSRRSTTSASNARRRGGSWLRPCRRYGLEARCYSESPTSCRRSLSSSTTRTDGAA
jgi:hypothetical protein